MDIAYPTPMARNSLTASMNPLVFCPCTLWPQSGTVTNVPRGSASRNRSAASAVSAAAGSAPVNAGPAEDPSYIWDLAATDVFPAASEPGPQTAAPGAVAEDGDPGAS